MNYILPAPDWIFSVHDRPLHCNQNECQIYQLLLHQPLYLLVRSFY